MSANLHSRRRSLALLRLPPLRLGRGLRVLAHRPPEQVAQGRALGCGRDDRHGGAGVGTLAGGHRPILPRAHPRRPRLVPRDDGVIRVSARGRGAGASVSKLGLADPAEQSAAEERSTEIRRERNGIDALVTRRGLAKLRGHGRPFEERPSDPATRIRGDPSERPSVVHPPPSVSSWQIVRSGGGHY